MKLTTFLYHEINNSPSEFHKLNNLYVNEDNFFNQLSYIKNEYNIISPKDLNNINLKNDNNAIISFDDSSKGIFKNALPILKELNIPAIFFLNMDVILDNYNYMTKIFFIKKYYKLKLNNNNIRNIFSININKIFKNSDIEKYNAFSGEWMSIEDLNNICKNNNFFLGNHLFNHYSINYLNINQIKYQYTKNESSLNKFKNYLPYFSYPFGQYKLDYNQKTNRILTDLGSKYIFTANFINNKINENLIHRVPLFNNTKPDQIKLHIKKDYIKSNLRSYLRLFL